jgi:hypothetical protein
MPQDVWTAVEIAGGLFVAALFTWLTAIVNRNTRAIQAHETVVKGLARATGTRVEGGARGGSGAARARGYPLWNQLGDPDPSGVLPVQRWNDCGEECCAELIARQHGVQVEADYLRFLLGGPRRLGQTTAEDLVKILALNNVAAEVQTPPAPALPVALQAATSKGMAVIVLGRWVAPGILHWVLCTRSDPAGMSANDPWGGVRRSWAWSDAERAYAGELVVVTRSPDP